MSAEQFDTVREALAWYDQYRFDHLKVKPSRIRGKRPQAALYALQKRMEQLEGERDALGNALAQERAKPGGTFDEGEFAQWQARAEAAERENERLRGALWRIAECAHPDPDWHRDKARSTLVAHTEEPR